MRAPPFLATLPVLAFAGLAAAFVAGGKPDGVADGVLDRPLPDFAQPALVAGDADLAADTLRGEVALLHVFAAWCSSCRAEHPTILSLAETTGLPVYGLNWKDSAPAARLYLARSGNPYRAVGRDDDGVLGAALGVTGVPETFVLDAEGRIRYRHVGPITPEIWQTVLNPLVTSLRKARTG